MNAVKSAGGKLHIGNFFVKELSQEDWDALCAIKKPYRLEDGTEIFYEQDIPAEMLSKYAHQIISSREDIKKYEEKVLEFETKLWWANADLRAMKELEKFIKEIETDRDGSI